MLPFLLINMDTIFQEVVKQIPALAVLAYIVVVFLKHLDKANKIIEGVNRADVEERRVLLDVIRENTRALTMNTEVIRNCIRHEKQTHI